MVPYTRIEVVDQTVISGVRYYSFREQGQFEAWDGLTGTRQPATPRRFQREANR